MLGRERGAAHMPEAESAEGGELVGEHGCKATTIALGYWTWRKGGKWCRARATIRSFLHTSHHQLTMHTRTLKHSYLSPTCTEK
jgi:hypothetical protein